MDAITHHITGIKCDTVGCGYEDDTAKFEEYDRWLNKPCPDCGGNLLTQTDLDATKAIMKMTETINRMIGPLPENSPFVNLSINMDGSGIKSIERLDEQPDKKKGGGDA